VIDLAGQDVGVLHTWGINDVSGFECDAATDVASIAPSAVTRFALLGNRPNPFDPSTVIRFAVPGEGATVTLSIFDVSGRRVRTLQDGFLPNGEHEISWNGLDEGGRRASAGIYFYRLESAEFRETRKMVLVR
jgi:hypothetical protein